MTTKPPASVSCLKRGKPATITTKYPLCPICQKAIQREPQDRQERDSLARWLSTRASAEGAILDSFDREADREEHLFNIELIRWLMEE